MGGQVARMVGWMVSNAVRRLGRRTVFLVNIASVRVHDEYRLFDHINAERVDDVCVCRVQCVRCNGSIS